MTRRRKLCLGVPAVDAVRNAGGCLSRHAYEVSGMGGKLGYSNPEDLDGTAMSELHVELEQPGSRCPYSYEPDLLEGRRYS